jgi:pimeloyl-ACP methyl ester carboxylesterase
MADRPNPVPDFLDGDAVSSRLFYPRPEWGRGKTRPGSRDFLVPVSGNEKVGARFHEGKKEGPVILFFHGNGEIVADYDDLAPVYTTLGINFTIVDYRGYGRSTGSPTVSAMLRDACDVFLFFRDLLSKEGFTGPFTVMGRSLGSAPALETAVVFQDRVDGLIIESGFARIVPLLRLIGVDPLPPGITEKEDRFNLERISAFRKPALVIHAEYDHIIPFSDGEALFAACPSEWKRFLEIPGANHNDIFLKGFRAYLSAVQELMKQLRTTR